MWDERKTNGSICGDRLDRLHQHKVVQDAITVASNCELAAVQSLDAGAAKVQADAFAVPWYEDAQRMLDEVECNAVYVATPQNVHLDNVRMAAAQGAARDVQKPLARNAKEASEMVRACEEAGVKFGTAFNCRFNSLHVKAREMIAEGMIGEVVSARCQYGQNYPPNPHAFRQKLELAKGGRWSTSKLRDRLGRVRLPPSDFRV